MKKIKLTLLSLLKRLLHTFGIYTIYQVEFMKSPVLDVKTGLYDYPVKLHEKVYKFFYITVYKKKV